MDVAFVVVAGLVLLQLRGLLPLSLVLIDVAVVVAEETVGVTYRFCC